MILLMIFDTLAETIWIGGHLISSIVILRNTCKKNDFKIISIFE